MEKEEKEEEHVEPQEEKKEEESRKLGEDEVSHILVWKIFPAHGKYEIGRWNAYHRIPSRSLHWRSCLSPRREERPSFVGEYSEVYERERANQPMMRYSNCVFRLFCNPRCNKNCFFLVCLKIIHKIYFNSSSIFVFQEDLRLSATTTDTSTPSEKPSEALKGKIALKKARFEFRAMNSRNLKFFTNFDKISIYCSLTAANSNSNCFRRPHQTPFLQSSPRFPNREMPVFPGRNS